MREGRDLQVFLNTWRRRPISSIGYPAHAVEERGDPDAELGLAVLPGFIGGFGLQADRDRAGPHYTPRDLFQLLIVALGRGFRARQASCILVSGLRRML